MMLSFTLSSISIALCISSALPNAAVKGLWIIIIETGDTYTASPAIAMTEAADAAIPSTLTVTFPSYSLSILKI